MDADILVTGSAFIDEHELDRLRAAGFTPQVLPSLSSVDELATALAGKRGYLWGAMETLPADSIKHLDALEVIGFPGSGYTEYIHGWREATERGVAIVAAVGMNAPAVAEYTITLILAMLRRLVGQAAAHRLDPAPARELSGLTLGVIGLGRTGRAVAARATALGMNVLGHSRSAVHVDGIQVRPLDILLEEADVITLHVDREGGRNLLGRTLLRRVRTGSLIVNVAFPDAVVWSDLRAEWVSGRLRAAYDAPPDGDHLDLPPDSFFASVRQTAFNTVEANRRAGDHITKAVIEVLITGNSAAVVNPRFADYRP